MNYGYQGMWMLTFVPAGFVITMAAFLAMCLVYAVGASRGRRSAALWVRFWSIAFVVAAGADLVYGVATGQLGDFLRLYGFTPLAEMIILAVLCVGSMWFMAVSYVGSKRDEAPVNDVAADDEWVGTAAQGDVRLEGSDVNA